MPLELEFALERVICIVAVPLQFVSTVLELCGCGNKIIWGWSLSSKDLLGRILSVFKRHELKLKRWRNHGCLALIDRGVLRSYFGTRNVVFHIVLAGAMAELTGFQVHADGPRYYESNVSLFMAPFVDVLVEGAVKKGHSVLDVACGSGFAARAAYKIAGPGAHIVGSDLNPGMVAMAKSLGDEGHALRGKGHALGHGICWQQASALELPFEDGQFDAVISQQGIQFFNDIAGGIKEMSRVLKKGGVLAATVWAPRAQSPYLDILFQLLNSHCNGDAKANSCWQVSGKGEISNWFSAAGVGEVNIQLIERVVQMPTITSYVKDHLKALPPPSVGNFFDLPEKEQNQMLHLLDNRLSQYSTSDGFDMPVSSYLVTVSP